MAGACAYCTAAFVLRSAAPSFAKRGWWKNGCSVEVRGADAFGLSLPLRHSVQSMPRMPKSVLVRCVYELGSLQKCECFFNSASKRAELYPKNHAVHESKLYFERTDDKKHHARAMTDYLSNTIPRLCLQTPRFSEL